MLQLLHPIWLLAGAAVMIPIVLHLWNTRQGKVYPVGSLMFMQQQAPQPAIHLKLTQLLLLLLRCLLLLLIALLLAQPMWQANNAPGKNRGWVLIDKSEAATTYTHCKPAIDSLLQAGYQLHYLQPGFEKTDTSSLQNDSSLPTPVSSYWALLPALQQQAPSDIDLYVFTNNYIHRFTGKRPAVNRSIHWITYTADNAVSHFINKAWFTTDKKIHLQLAHTSSGSTTYTYQEITTVSAQQDSFTLLQKDGLWQVALLQQPPVTVDTSLLRIGILEAEDAPYVQAALTAIHNFTHLNMQLVMLKNNNPASEKFHWLIWLSAQPVPSHYQADHTLRYDTGKTEISNSAVITGNLTAQLTIQQRTQVTTSPALQTLWQDGFGQPLLYTSSHQPQVYRFASRFNPAWNNLTWNPAFPRLLLQLLQLQPASENAFTDKRSIDALQLQPDWQSSPTITNASTQAATPLSPICWLLAVAVFALERFFTHTSKKGGQVHAA